MFGWNVLLPNNPHQAEQKEKFDKLCGFQEIYILYIFLHIKLSICEKKENKIRKNKFPVSRS